MTDFDEKMKQLKEESIAEFGWIEPLKQKELKDNLKVRTVKRR